MLSNRLVIGLDYGTTYTGVSFCETSDTGVLEKHIEVIKDWPSRHTKIGTKEKVPSEIAYLPEGMQWGSLIPPNVQRHMWTKLELDTPKAGEAAKILKELSLSNCPSRKQPIEIIADYLRQIKDHLVKNLDSHFGPELWRTLPITLVVTVPAVWSDGAKDRTMQAVVKAGFNAIQFPKLKRVITATEPEAAAIYTIKSFSGSVQDEQFKIGDGFIVCDMGGGTVDLISYRVADLEPTTLEEATIGSGDQCGGTFVDRAFIRWLERRLGEAAFTKLAGARSDEIARTSLSNKLNRMVQDFVLEVKSGFSGIETNFLRLPHPLSAIDDDAARGITDGEIMITPADMEEMFEFPLRRTYELLLDQIKRARTNGSGVTLKHVLMVGGFSESPYVYAKMKFFAEANGLQAIRPAFAKSDAYICPFEGTKHARNQASWLITKGQDLSASIDCHAELSYSKFFWAGNNREATVDLIASDLDFPPQSSMHESVYTVATLIVDLSCVPEHHFELRRSPQGVAYYQLGFQLEINIQSVLEYSLSVNGKKYGSVTAKYT